MFQGLYSFRIYILFLLGGLLLASCKKLISIDPPTSTLPNEKVFANDNQANQAVAGIYNALINGNGKPSNDTYSKDVFSAGLTTYAGGFSAGEFYPAFVNSGEDGIMSSNSMTKSNSNYPLRIWKSAYETIYNCNSVIEGIKASTSINFSDSARKIFMGEAKFVRAFCFFYLTNFFGDIPLPLTVDFNKTTNLPRAPVQDVYQQILNDLLEAEQLLLPNYNAAQGRRVRVNSWGAKAMLARVYLYMKNYPQAAAKATEVIGHNTMFYLEPSLDDVFSTTSKEAIWQLRQAEGSFLATYGDVPEVEVLVPDKPIHTAAAKVMLSNELLAAFEPGDLRYKKWTDSTTRIVPELSPDMPRYPAKYKFNENKTSTSVATQYYTVLRLAELYLIRAEAMANGAPGGISGALLDLKAIRERADLDELPAGVDIHEAIAREREVELFAEWGARWFDLKRTGKASAVLSVNPNKQPWLGDYQLLYPIPEDEIQKNPFLIQNPVYNQVGN